ncbi:MAG: regulatory protein RecX [Candidatus Doudnabacteria bacterium]
MNIEEKAKSLLKIRPHHSEELAKKLLMRGFDREQVNAVIAKLTDEKLIDNQQFAQNYLDSLIRYKSFGFYGLKAKLMQRGIDGKDAEALLKENLPIETEKEIALKAVEKSQEKDKAKLAQKLSRKGFRSEVIREVVKTK